MDRMSEPENPVGLGDSGSSPRMGPSAESRWRGGGSDVLEIRGLAKSYREGDKDHVILSGAEAVLAEGEFAALLGPSGSGKSTLLNLISGIDLPDAGSVLIRGFDLTRASEKERTLYRRRHIG